MHLLCYERLYACRELYHGLQWRTDVRFCSPMVLSPCGNVFVGDFAKFSNGDTICVGHIRQFFCKVMYWYYVICIALPCDL